MHVKLLVSRIFLIASIVSIIAPTQLLKAQSVPSNELVLPPTICEIPFRWQEDKVRGTTEKTAILLPVSLENCPRVFYMQFDLGSPYSMLYKNKIEDIKTRYPEAIPNLVDPGRVSGFSFKAGESKIFAKEIVVKQFDSSSVNWISANAIEIIGTVGTDLIDAKFAIINYPQRIITISDTIPQIARQDVSWGDLIYTNRQVLLPAKINGRENILYFDTGSSMFELLTDKQSCYQLAVAGSTATSYQVQSWDKVLTANTLPSDQFVEFANVKIPLRAVTYIDGVADSQVEHMRRLGIGGMTGNKLFLNYVLMLDTRNKKFALKEYHQH